MQMRAAVRDPVLLALLTTGLLLAPWFLAGPGGTTMPWVIQAALDVLMAYIAWRLARHPEMPAAGRRFWQVVMIACASCAIGDTYQCLMVLANPGTTRISLVQTTFVVAGMATVVVATLRHPLGGAGRQRLRLWFDTATVLTGVAVFLWYFLLAEEIGGRHDSDRWAASATAVVMLLIAFGVLKLILSGTAPFTRVSGSAAALGVAGTALAAPITTGLVGDPGLGLMTVVQLLPCVLTTAALRLQQLQAGLLAPRLPGPLGPRSSRLPYLAVVATQLLLVWSLREKTIDSRLWGVAIGVVVITALVLGRQLVAFRDNERLLGELDEQRERFRALVQNTSDLTLVVDPLGKIDYASPAAERVLGLTPEQLLETNLYDRTHPDDLSAVNELSEQLAARPGHGVTTQLRWRHADGTHRWLDVVSTDLRNNPSVGGVVLNARDATETRALHDELRRQASHDALTGLANRVLLHRRLQESAAVTVSMLLIDLDGFKQVNDLHGHHAGDVVLQTVAERLTGMLGAGELAARLGGDEFAVLLPGTAEAEATNLAEQIAAVVAEPMMVAGQWLSVGASVGVATGTPGEGDGLLREADALMYERKKARKAGGTALTDDPSGLATTHHQRR
ncbi:diguanylate cyclase (GGDEF)-like protein/PAS domain S-box-containing protein [Actinoplanes lutulentus]|uniref:PAS domain S-box-containing protein/diguanylate cyclase (GGDEF)-like protein n=1 Tax=Actinoplanes lutulentus TaxID=1287878 RepID=A0A327ZI73_9ACTN|nr:sensor domain-containing diguanylate cyclase [Actinoplanes lutulentus]MBB2947990.1 diguanylate cyclase (GGDEF)-like protein/PAS domain S-box-containing protein [Actinoplanes lutulentus]RAK40129.1 PAS domain S-box-containing protein/diguanylate cyclase (GGDEF)-like protein [Actinoplanes lutulentus]